MSAPRTDEEIREIARLYHAGLGEIRIARELNIPFSTVRTILRGETKAARRVLGGRLLQGRRKQADLVPWKNQYAKAKKGGE